MGTGMGFSRDVRHTLRGLAGRLGLSVTVVLTVALAVGATTSVFSVVNGVLLRPLDFPEPDRLVRAWQTRPSWMGHDNPQLRAFAERFPLSVPTFRDWQDTRTGLESMGIYTSMRWVHQSEEGAELIGGGIATSGVFDALGVGAEIGRTLTPDDDIVGAPAVALLSHGFWLERYGAEASVLGRSISLDGRPHTIVGVMPAGFSIPTLEGRLWATFSESAKLDERDSQSYTVMARLRPGATVESARADLDAVQTRLSESYPDDQADMRSNVEGLLTSMVGGIRPTLLFLLATVGIVLTIACVNIANMLSVAGLSRRRELAVKAAIGASRGQLVRGLLAESIVLAGVGGLLGLVLASITLPALVAVLPDSLPRLDAIGVDLRVLGFGVAVTAATAVLVGVLPALQAAGTDPKQMMDATGRGLAGGRSAQRVRGALVVTEIALAFVLLVGASLLSTSFARLWRVDRGFESAGLIAMAVFPSSADFPERADRDRVREELGRRFRAIPGATVTRANQIPLSGSISSTTYLIDRGGEEPEEATVMISVVGDDYFDVAEISFVEGRTFDGRDEAGAPRVGIVNRALARTYWPGESAIGKTLRPSLDGDPVTVVGVANDVRHQGLHQPASPKLYVPAEQDRREADYWLIRAEGDLAAVGDLAREAVAVVAPSTPVRNITVLEERIADSVAVPRFRTLFVVGLAGIATVLALLGVYGVVTFAVSQRTRELAVRMAIGANPGEIVIGTLKRGLRLSVVGVGIGFLIAWRAGGLVDDFLFEVGSRSITTYVAVAALIATVTAAAAYAPARRAARVDPVVVLNAE